MVNMKCKMPTCTFNTVDEIDETSKVGAHLSLLGFHVDAIHPKSAPQPLAVQQPAPANPRTEKIAHPKLEMKDGSSSEEQWNFLPSAGSSTRPSPTLTGTRGRGWGSAWGTWWPAWCTVGSATRSTRS